ncbi:AmmeMemoRadiSam system protein B [Desulfovibrio aerotolerans]|uniref:MEMO1 family protein GTA51_17060 n=1 Tax=Solidesulfovibrio aerotolerans TaxID=295255 RepID=A0A7C9IN63_9BACT|nr:AmmeMemoRadiSam system protein B [Solidesulfovibrio aerotolerans]MYL84825.1 AmmeMemoRadiSam system protein B [Solidesulfovibrio aerotolerans]
MAQASPRAVTGRQPVVAGRFYPGDAETLARETAAYLALAALPSERPTLLAMAPHAGAVYSGPVAGRTLGAARLADTLLLLGPNHTGRGARLAVWPSGDWHIPGQDVPVDEALAAALLTASPRLTPDREAHLGEHSLEVLLPFLRQVRPDCRIVPVAVAEPDLTVLADAAAAMAGVLARWPEPVSVVVSSDMSHYVSHKTATRLDSLALERALALDPEGLYRVVREAGITMCGVLPMVLGLFTVLALGAKSARLAAYATSGEVSGDYEQVVGYAGVLVE